MFLSLRPPRRRAVLGMGFIAVACLALINISNRRPPEDALPLLPVGKTTSSVGVYRLFGSELTLQIHRDQNGEIHADIRSPRMTTQFVPFTPIPLRILHDTQRECGGVISSGVNWFVSVDECKNLWVCCGRPGSSRPNVTVYGLRFFPPNNRLVRGFEGVLETGNWTGVPPQFLERIHAEYDTDLVPTEPRGYTEDQALQIARLQKRPTNQ